MISKKDYSWSQNEIGLIQFGLIMYTGAVRMLTYQILTICFKFSTGISDWALSLGKFLSS